MLGFYGAMERGCEGAMVWCESATVWCDGSKVRRPHPSYFRTFALDHRTVGLDLAPSHRRTLAPSNRMIARCLNESIRTVNMSAHGHAVLFRHHLERRSAGSG